MGALGHDAGHFAASRMPWVNEWGVWGMSLICNPVVLATPAYLRPSFIHKRS